MIGSLVPTAARIHAVARRVVDGVVGGVLQGALGQARAGEHLAHRREVEVLTGVARGREREVAAVSGQAARTIASAWSGLLEERGKTGRRVAERELDRAVGRGDDDGAVVDRLDETATHVVREDRGVVEGGADWRGRGDG